MSGKDVGSFCLLAVVKKQKDSNNLFLRLDNLLFLNYIRGL